MESKKNTTKLIILATVFVALVACGVVYGDGGIDPIGSGQPLAKIKILNAVPAFNNNASVVASPDLLGQNGENNGWVAVNFTNPHPDNSDWIGVFSPAKFDASTCAHYSSRDQHPFICSAPIKYKWANTGNKDYWKNGKNGLHFRLINQRSDFSFALFSGGLDNPKLIAVSNTVTFTNPKAPVYPRLALGKSWDEMTLTWTSGYNIDEAVPVVEWGLKGEEHRYLSPAGTLTFKQNSMCGEPARTVGWRDPGFIHTTVLKNLWPNTEYTYRLGHKLTDKLTNCSRHGGYVWSDKYSFKSSPYPGQDSLQRVVVFGDLGTAARDGSSEYSNYQYGALQTTDQLIRDLENYDMVFHIGDLAYANGYLSEWDQFTEQVEPIASTKAYMTASGNHERDYTNSGSFYNREDSGGECGVPMETMFSYPAENTAKFWYSADFGMFHFCVADTEHDWREGTEQYAFIEKCLASADRKKQPWLIFTAHRVLGYSSNNYYGEEGSYEEPMGRDDIQKLLQKYRVDIAFYGHVHNYERTCPIYQNQCVDKSKDHYSGTMKGTIHIVAGNAGAHLNDFNANIPNWSIHRDEHYGYVKMTAYNHSSLLFEYIRSMDGKMNDAFTISRDYRDVLACVQDSCAPTTLAG